jgi:dihydroxyacetone kinase
MTRIYNDPADFADEALAGFCDLHSGLVRQVPDGAVRRHRPVRPKVAVLAGGGSGHYPAFAGLIGNRRGTAPVQSGAAHAARRLAEKNLGTADPGATSLAMIFTVMGPHFTAVHAPAAAVS